MGNINKPKELEMEVVCKSCGKKVKLNPQCVYRDYDSFLPKYYWHCSCGDHDNRVLLKNMESEFKRIVKLLNQNRSGAL